MVQRTFALLLLSLLVANPRSLFAQGDRTAADLLNMSLEDLMQVEVDSVYGTSGYKQKVSDAPASITVITADEIRRYGYRTLADVLRQVPGFYVSYDRDYSYLGERGFGRPGDYNSRILLQIDGHRSNDNLYDSGLLGTEFPIDLDLIDRLEVIRGPNSSLYNASAFLGVINIVTKQSRDVRGLTLSEELASYGTFKSRATYSHHFDSGLQVILSGTYYNSHGHDALFFSEFNTPAMNNGMAQNIDHDRAAQVFFNLSYKNLRLEGVYASREKEIPTAAFGSIFNDPGMNSVDSPGYLDLKYDHHFGNNWGYFGRVYYDNYQYRGAYPNDYSDSGGPARVANRDAAMGQDAGAEFAISRKLGESQTLVVGSEFRDNFKQNQLNYDAQPYYQYFNSLESSNLWGVYAQDAVQFRHGLALDLGLRYDDYSTFGNTVNPRAALIYDPFAQATFKLLYGQSFRAPNAYEMYYAGYGQEPNFHLQPETVRTMEAVYEQGLPHDIRVVVSGYYYPIRGLINAENDANTGAIIYENTQRVDLKGLEFTVKRQLRAGLEAGASLSFEHARDLDSHDTLTNSPHTLGQANLSVPLIKRKLFASGNLEYVSRRRALEGDYAGSYVVPNFTLFSQDIVKGWEVSTSLYNAFDRIYGDPGSVEHVEHVIFQDGRNFRLKVVYHF